MNNLECRKQKMNGKMVCKKTGEEVDYSVCNNCKLKKYKATLAKTMKKRTYKQYKAEKDRFSIFTEDLDHCLFCGRQRENLHEVIFGRNRHNSIKYGLVIPLCYEHHLECHKNSQLQDVWKKDAQKKFEKVYPDLDFIKIFGKNYK